MYAGNAVVGRGIAVCAGAACGVLVFSSAEAAECRQQGIDCILCRDHPDTDDLAGFMVSERVERSVQNDVSS